MIEWKMFDPKTAADEIEEDDFLIVVNGRIIQATHDAMSKWFTRPSDDGEIIYSYRTISHYANFNFPERINE